MACALRVAIPNSVKFQSQVRPHRCISCDEFGHPHTEASSTSRLICSPTQLVYQEDLSLGPNCHRVCD